MGHGAWGLAAGFGMALTAIGAFGSRPRNTGFGDAERLLDEHLRRDPLLRAEWERDQKLRDDPRVTRVGGLLRKTSLDELPQLWNVLKGEMSLVGPRPIVEAEVPKYEGMYQLYRRVAPGISGVWQVSGRNDTTYEERVAMDAYYVRNWSVWLDLVVLARTVVCVILRTERTDARIPWRRGGRRYAHRRVCS